ncbi:metalloprotease [Kitasatospora aureofaciens]|uniref:hypothetical protein n=1 Tax=Kitasatospora aureofaciens TaxID=1894 RepID=UPI0009A0C2EB|nr:metalloprotease [Streptomyces viridifaciens]
MGIGKKLSRRFAAFGAAVLAGMAAVPLSATSAAAVGAPVCLSGNLLYDYQSADAGTSKPTMTKPVRSANVELWGNEKPTDSPHRLTADFQYTAGDGGFKLCHTPTTTSMSSMWVRFNAESTKLWRVNDTRGATYTLDSQTLHNVSSSASLGVIKPSSDTARAWHAFDTVNLLWWNRDNPASICWSSHETDGNHCTELNIQWTDTSTDGPYYDIGSHTIHLSAADPDSEHTVLHESGHFFMNRLFNGFPSYTICTSQYIYNRAGSGTCAWVEGFADAVAAYLLGDYRYVWPNGTEMSFAYSSGWGTGDQVEGNVTGSLLDLWRNVDGGNWNRTITLLTSTAPSTFSEYFNTDRPKAGPPLSTGWDALSYLRSHSIQY